MKYRYRTGLFGKVVLQVYAYYEGDADGPAFWAWRDATLKDIPNLPVPK